MLFPCFRHLIGFVGGGMGELKIARVLPTVALGPDIEGKARALDEIVFTEAAPAGLIDVKENVRQAVDPQKAESAIMVVFFIVS